MKEDQRGAGSAGDTEGTQVPFQPFGLGEPPRELWGEVTIEAFGSLSEERIHVPFTKEELGLISRMNEISMGFKNHHLSVNTHITEQGALSNREATIRRLQYVASRAEAFLQNHRSVLSSFNTNSASDDDRQRYLDYINMYFIRLALDPFVTPPTPEDLADPDAYAQKKIARVNALIEGKSVE